MKTNSESSGQYLSRVFDVVQLRERNFQEWNRHEHAIAQKDSFKHATYSQTSPDTKPVTRTLYHAWTHPCGAVCRIPGRQYGESAYVVVTNQRAVGRLQIGPEWFTLDGAKAALLRYVKEGLLSE